MIDELEKLLVLLEDPLQQEVEAAKALGERLGAETARPKKSEKEWESEMAAAVEKARKQVRQEMDSKFSQKKEKACTDSINALLDLLYFGAALDPYNPYNHERHACLAYATAAGSSLTSEALDTLGFVSRLLTARPFNGAAMNHKDALEACQQAAVRYVLNPNAVVHPSLPTIRGQDLKDGIKAIKALDYFVVVPNVNVTPGLATPALAVPPPVGVGVGVGVGTLSDTGAPAPVPTNEVETSVLETKPAASLQAQREVVKVQQHPAGGDEENLMARLFGGQHQFQSRHASSSRSGEGVQDPAPAPPPTEEAPEIDRTPAFAGDYDLGIENVQISSNQADDQTAKPNGHTGGRGRHQGGRGSEHGRNPQHRRSHHHNPHFNHNNHNNNNINKPRGGGPGGRFRGGRGGGRHDYNRKPREDSRPEQV